MSESGVACAHCGEACPDAPPIQHRRDGQVQWFCCQGCAAVSSLIHAAGLGRFYRFRTRESRRATDDLDALATAWQACDERESLWGEPRPNGEYDLLLQAEGVQCAACAWLIRNRLEPLAGVRRADVDLATGFTRILWDPAKLRLSRIALELARLGYRPHLPLAAGEESARLAERRRSMLRLGVAGLGMMQVMMYAVGLYAGDALGITEAARRFLEWTSLLVTLPVLLFAGRPFFENAWRQLAQRRVGMDVPVALAIGTAFVASTVNFLRDQGDVWFDSVVMFIFFLTVARHVQLVQGHRNLQSSTALARLLPEWAQRLEADGQRTIPAVDLAVGDRVRVAPGEPFPADGRVLGGATEVDESLLTGESRLIPRRSGDAVVGGSINVGQAVDVVITACGRDTTVSALGRLVMGASKRPSRVAAMAERLAAAFVTAVLLVALLAGLAWWAIDASRVLPVMLSVLVVSCPCALSLATPAALAAVSRRLVGAGILVTRDDALERLAVVDTAVFDKTGTLTGGRPEIEAIVTNPARRMTADQATRIAAALESHSAHPLARAFRSEDALPAAQGVEILPHAGLRGEIEHVVFRLGSRDFAGGDTEPSNRAQGSVWLADDEGWLARFDLGDPIRPGARRTLRCLERAGIQTVMASGDTPAAVAWAAGELGITRWYAAQTAAEKMRRVEQWQDEGQVLLMVGDGVNDAPVLAAADVSITVAGATDLAHSAADVILTGVSLEGVMTVRSAALAVRRTIRQNLLWAIAYNVSALPLAVLGLLQPWMAALGMSLSSLLVVANSARLARATQAELQP